jgi:hypothetical protein
MTDKTTIILTLIISFFSPIIPLFIVIGSAVLLDTIFGLIKSKKLGIIIISSRLFQGIALKTFIYLSTLTLFFLAENFILNDITGLNFMITKAMALLFTGIEFYSIDENIREFNNQKGFKHYFLIILNNVKSYLIKLKDFKDKFNDLK